MIIMVLLLYRQPHIHIQYYMVHNEYMYKDYKESKKLKNLDIRTKMVVPPFSALFSYTSLKHLSYLRPSFSPMKPH